MIKQHYDDDFIFKLSVKKIKLLKQNEILSILNLFLIKKITNFYRKI